MQRGFHIRPARTAEDIGVAAALFEAYAASLPVDLYRQLRLDTLATMDAAIALYGRMGFTRIAPYYAPTSAGTIFMGLDLAGRIEGP